MINLEENKSRKFLLRLRNFLIKDFFKTIHSIPRGVIYSSLLMILHYFQIFSYSFGNLDNFSYGQTEISLLFQKVCVYSKIFPLFTIISGISDDDSLKIWLVSSFVLNMIWVSSVIIQGFFSDRKDYKMKKLLMILTTVIFQLYHWVFFLTFLQACFEFIFKGGESEIYYLIIAIINILFVIGIGLLNQRFETSYLFKITDFLERRPSFYFYASFFCKIMLIFIYCLKLQTDINIWAHFFLSWLLILESVEKFSFINFIIMQVYSALSCIYAYIIIAYILLYYLNQNNIKTFDLAFSICICLPVLIKISLNLYDYIHQKCLLLNIEKINNITILDQTVRVLYHNLKHSKKDKNSLLQIESWIIDHIRSCIDATCPCKPFLKNNSNFEQSIALKKKLTKLILSKNLEKALKSIKGQNSTYLHFIYLTFLLQILKIPTKSFAESLKLGEKSKKFGLGDRVFTEIFIEQAATFFEKNLVQNKLKNQKLDFMKLIKFEEKSLKLYEDLIKLILEYIEFYGMMSHSFIDLNQLEAKINFLIRSRGLIDLNLNTLVKMNPKSMILQEISMIFYFYLFPINQLEHQNKDLLRLREELTKKNTNFELFDAEAAVVSITLLKHHGIIRSHSRNFSKMMKYDTLINENISRIMPKMFSEVHTQILERFIDEGKFSLTKDDDRTFFAMDKQNFIFPIRLKIKIDVFGTDDFGATGFLHPINKKFCYALASLEGRVLNISKRLFEKSFFRLISEVSWKQLYRINFGICMPSLLFQFYGVSDQNLYEEVFDTIFLAPKNPKSEEIQIFTQDFGEETDRSAHSLSMDFNKEIEKSFHTSMSRISKRGNREKSQILDKLTQLKGISAYNLRLYSAKVKMSLFRYKKNDLKFVIIEIQSLSGIHKNKQKIYDKYLQKLITSYEETEKADIKLFTTTQISSLGLFADQGFIFRDSADSIRSSLINEKDKESQRGPNTAQRVSEFIPEEKQIIKTLDSGSYNQDASKEFHEFSNNSDNLLGKPSNNIQEEVISAEEKQKKELEQMLLQNLKEKVIPTNKKDMPNSYDFVSSAKHLINFKERLQPYNTEIYFHNPPMLRRGPAEAQNEDLLGLESQEIGKGKDVREQLPVMLSEIKEEEKRVTTENNENHDEPSDDFVFIEDKEEKDNKENQFDPEKPHENEADFIKPEKQEENQDTPVINSKIADEKQQDINENFEKKVFKNKEKNKMKALNFAQNQRKLKIVESISSSSENSSTKVVKKNFMHLIKNKNLPFSLKVISFLGYLGFLGLAITFSVLYAFLYQNFQDLNENMINIMFGHHFARPLGFIMKGIEQKVLLESFYSDLPDKESHYNDIQLLNEALGDYEYSYLQLINLNVKFEYQYIFMNAEMGLKLYNLDQDPTEINLVLIHAFGLFIEHLRMCLKQNGTVLLERGNDAYYFLYQNSIEIINQMIEINVSTAQEASAQLDKIRTMIVLFLVLAELVIFFICLIILPIFIQVNRRKEDALVLFCSFQQDVLINKISMYTNIYNEIISRINDISDQYSKTLSDVSFINLIKKQRKKISISQHSKLKVNFSRVTFIIILSFVVISIYPLINFIITNEFLNSFSLNIQENIVFGKLSSSFSLFYAINYFNINYQFYVYKQGLPLLNETITRSWDLNFEIFTEIINYAGYDLDQLISSPYVTNEHKQFLLKIKSENLCDLIDLTPENKAKCSKIYKGQMKLGLIVVLKSISNDFKDIFNIIAQYPNDHNRIESWLVNNNFFDLDQVLEYMQPITTLIIDNSISNFQNYLSVQITLVTGLFIFGISVLILIGGFGFLKLIKYLNELLFEARFLLSVLPMDLIQENSYLMSHLTKEFKKIKL